MKSDWKSQPLPTAALASIITDELLSFGGHRSFDEICKLHPDATAGQVCEALATGFICRQLVPENDAWRASKESDFVIEMVQNKPTLS